MDVVIRDNHASELQMHLYRMYQNGAMTDLQVVASNWNVYNVHRLVVTASSQYLHNLCNSNGDNHTVNLGKTTSQPIGNIQIFMP